MVTAAPLAEPTVGALRDNLRRDAGLELDLAYVGAIERSASGKHRFVISRI